MLSKNAIFFSIYAISASFHLYSRVCCLMNELKFNRIYFFLIYDADVALFADSTYKELQKNRLLKGNVMRSNALILLFARFRQLTVENVRPSLHCEQLTDLSYSHQLYKLRNDSYTFEKLYELFDHEDEEEFQFENISHEWSTCRGGALKAEQTGVVVLKVQQMDLIDHSRYQLEVCIDYHIDLVTSKSEHQLFAGNFTLDAGVLASDQFRPSFLSAQSDFFKDLLAIKFASSFLALLISFSQSPKSKLTDFIEQTLRFRRISSGSSTVSHKLISVITHLEIERKISRPSNSIIWWNTHPFFNNTPITFISPMDLWRAH
jgi:hypothetical protein